MEQRLCVYSKQSIILRDVYSYVLFCIIAPISLPGVFKSA